MGRKFGGSAPFRARGGAVAWAGPTSIPSDILIHAAIWPQQIWAEIVVCARLGEGSWVPTYHNVARAEAHLHAKFHLDPSNRLATVHERHIQTDRQDRQRTDSIGRTVLQTVAQKLDHQTIECRSFTHACPLDVTDKYHFVSFSA